MVTPCLAIQNGQTLFGHSTTLCPLERATTVESPNRLTTTVLMDRLTTGWMDRLTTVLMDRLTTVWMDRLTTVLMDRMTTGGAPTPGRRALIDHHMPAI